VTENTASAPVPNDHIMGVYNRTPLAFERGEGARLFTIEGEEYLDCMAGIAVNALGHANPKLVQAVKDQAEKLWHVSNIFTIPGQEKLAKVLTDATFADVVFSGTRVLRPSSALLRPRANTTGPRGIRNGSILSDLKDPSMDGPWRQLMPRAMRPISKASARKCRALYNYPMATTTP